MSAISFCLFKYSSDIMEFFQKESDVVQIGSRIIKFFSISLPLIPLTIVTNMVFQVTEQIGISIFLSSCRQGIFFIPLIFVLPAIFGITGLELCQPIANTITSLVSLPFIVRYFRKLKE